MTTPKHLHMVRAFDHPPRFLDRTREAWDEDEYDAWQRAQTPGLAALASVFTLIALAIFAYVIARSL